MNKLNGLMLSDKKNTQNFKTVKLPIPETVLIPMSMCMGASCTPFVEEGDHVFKGQLIGDSDKAMSVPVHSSVSGTVMKITDYELSDGNSCKAVVIRSDVRQEVQPNIKPPVIKDRDSFMAAVRSSGACGLGGAGFPTYIKLDTKASVDTLIINAAECEPYITSDYRELIERTEDVIKGIMLVMKYTGIPKAKLCIESNKPKAIKKLIKMTADLPSVKITPLPSRYPQGAEKVLIYSATGRIVMEGELPSDQGVTVLNCSTLSFLYRYSRDGMPLVTRRITVDGDAVENPCNLFVPVGTPVKDVLSYAKAKDYKELIMGGPMMGVSLLSDEMPIIKTSNAVLAVKKPLYKREAECIRCGRCIRSCPIKLMPTELEKAYRQNDKKTLKKLKVNLCINCGCCSYVCPAHKKLAEINQLAKLTIR